MSKPLEGDLEAGIPAMIEVQYSGCVPATRHPVSTTPIVAMFDDSHCDSISEQTQVSSTLVFVCKTVTLEAASAISRIMIVYFEYTYLRVRSPCILMRHGCYNPFSCDNPACLCTMREKALSTIPLTSHDLQGSDAPVVRDASCQGVRFRGLWDGGRACTRTACRGMTWTSCWT